MKTPSFGEEITETQNTCSGLNTQAKKKKNGHL